VGKRPGVLRALVQLGSREGREQRSRFREEVGALDPEVREALRERGDREAVLAALEEVRKGAVPASSEAGIEVPRAVGIRGGTTTVVRAKYRFEVLAPGGRLLLKLDQTGPLAAKLASPDPGRFWDISLAGGPVSWVIRPKLRFLSGFLIVSTARGVEIGTIPAGGFYKKGKSPITAGGVEIGWTERRWVEEPGDGTRTDIDIFDAGGREVARLRNLRLSEKNAPYFPYEADFNQLTDAPQPLATLALLAAFEATHNVIWPGG
jgi:hypothetical protein